MIEQILREIGLTDYEARIYLALLELGKSSSGEILKKAGIRSGKIYEILSSLEDKGLVSEVSESGVRKFSPADPKRVYDYLEEKKQKITNQEKNFEKIMPELMKKINSNKEDVKVEIFYGRKGMKTAYMKEFDYDKKGKTVRIVGVRGKEFYDEGLYNFFINTIYPKRIASKVNIKKIYSKSAKKYRHLYEKNADIRYFFYTSPVTFVVIDKLVIIGIQSKNNNLTITIESEEVAGSFIQQFEALWKMSKE